MESTEIVKANTGIIRSVDDLSRIGKMMAVSGYFIDARDAAQAAVKVQAGLEMGFGPFASMTGIHIIKGRPSVGANLMASAVKSNPKYDYRVRKMEDEEVKIEFFQLVDGKWESIGVSSFTAAEAKKAGTQNMEKFPRNMLFARAISNGIRWFCPDVFAGNPTYTPEELGAAVDDDGNVVSIPQTEPQKPAAIEAEATPITAEPAEQKPAFDEHEFLKGWRHRADLPAVSLNNAVVIENRDGVPYGKIPVEKLFHMLNALQKRVNSTQVDMEKEPLLQKMGAINTILSAKASALEQLEAAADPHLKS